MVIGWRENNLTEFAIIQELLLVAREPFAVVTHYITQGIDSHYLCYCLIRTNQSKVIPIKDLQGFSPMIGDCQTGSSRVYIVIRSRILDLD